MLAFGATNRYLLTPRLLPTSVPAEENNRSLRLLCASISMEIAFNVCSWHFGDIHAARINVWFWPLLGHRRVAR
jgi:hypothetical protein